MRYKDFCAILFALMPICTDMRARMHKLLGSMLKPSKNLPDTKSPVYKELSEPNTCRSGRMSAMNTDMSYEYTDMNYEYQLRPVPCILD